MDWITTSGRTLDEAKSHALDQLGIVADEAEFDVVNDVEKGLFGRVKTEAKIRARVRPKQTVTKDDRGRRRNGGGSNRNRGQKGGRNKGRKGDSDRGDGLKGGDAASSDKSGSKKSGSNKSGSNKSGSKPQQTSGSQGGRGQAASRVNKAQDGSSAESKKPKQQTNRNKNDKPKKDIVEEHMNREDQERVAQSFLEGVLTAFEMNGEVAVVEEQADDGAIEMVVTGEELGLLVGQKGLTLNSLQELTRTVVQRKADGAKTDRLRVDVAGYRARRTAALQSFAVKIASEVVDSGSEKLLEPMGPADRKVVHDALTDVDGVETGSEGEEPRRRVVIRPT